MAAIRVHERIPSVQRRFEQCGETPVLSADAVYTALIPRADLARRPYLRAAHVIRAVFQSTAERADVRALHSRGARRHCRIR